MKTLMATLLASGFALAACGQSEAPSTEASVAEPAAVEPAVIEPDIDESPGALPPPVSFAQDGDVIQAKVGDEISVKLDLPEDASTGVLWTNVEGQYPSMLDHSRTYHTLEGALRYSDVILNAAEAGETQITYQAVQQGQPINDDQRTLTFIISN